MKDTVNLQSLAVIHTVHRDTVAAGCSKASEPQIGEVRMELRAASEEAQQLVIRPTLQIKLLTGSGH
jgi:hypothetical protein